MGKICRDLMASYLITAIHFIIECELQRRKCCSNEAQALYIIEIIIATLWFVEHTSFEMQILLNAESVFLKVGIRIIPTAMVRESLIDRIYSVSINCGLCLANGLYNYPLSAWWALQSADWGVIYSNLHHWVFVWDLFQLSKKCVLSITYFYCCVGYYTYT